MVVVWRCGLKQVGHDWMVVEVICVGEMSCDCVKVSVRMGVCVGSEEFETGGRCGMRRDEDGEGKRRGRGSCSLKPKMKGKSGVKT